jgi:hypothetical protein
MKQEAQGEQTHQNTADWQPIHYSVEWFLSNLL